MDLIYSVLPIYFFIILGFVAKRVFQTRVDEKSLVVLVLYIFQPILIFWGLSKANIDFNFVLTPVVYLLILFFTLIIIYFLSLYIFKTKQEQNIYLAVSLVGNTGNLGIPLGIALFGVESIPYTTVINIANIIYMYLFSSYFLAKTKFDFKSSLKSISKIPAIYFSIFALSLNYLGVKIDSRIDEVLKMGAYTSIVLQLVIFGIYLSNLKLRSVPYSLVVNISIVKHILLPIVGFVAITFVFDLGAFISVVLFMELLVPLAVNNVNFASLYNTRPHDVASAIFFSSIVFVLFLYFYLDILDFIKVF